MKILIAEDNLTDLKLLGAVLQAQGHQVFPATDGLEAWQLLQREHVEAVISDILMPRMDGYRLCRTVRQSQEFASIPFIFYTSTYTSNEDERLALRFGADKYLKKPASYDEIFQAIQQAPRKRSTNSKPVLGLKEQPVMKEYSEALVRKLDQKVAELAAAREQLAGLNQELERRVQERTAQLEAANREMEAFIYSVSHDLRAPLRGIDGLTVAVLEDFEPSIDVSAKELLAQIRTMTGRMHQLIDGLLNLSHTIQAPMHREKVDLSTLAKEILNDLRLREPAREAQITVEENLWAMGDLPLLRVALQNLLENAWKFTSKKGLAQIRVGTMLDQSQPVFFVSDNGAGFEMAYVKKLFGPFQRLHSKDDYSGNGIGLATAQRIIHRHGGRIWARAEPDAGAVFFFMLAP